LTGLIDLGEETDVADGLGGIGEVGAICPQVREDGCKGLFSDPRDRQKIFSWKGVFGFLR